MSVPSPPKPQILPRRVIAALVAATLASGVAVGAALGPAPQSSSSRDAQSRFLASALVPLIARARAAQPIAATQPIAADDAATSAPDTNPATGLRARHRRPPTHTPATPTPRPTVTSETSPTTSATETDSSANPPGGAGGAKRGQQTNTSAPVKLPPITHVWLIVLDRQSFGDALAQHTADPYLAGSLVRKGTLLSDYSLLARAELANDVSLLSGQSPNADTEQNCPTYTEVQPATVDPSSGLASGVGCVYPKAAQTLADELATGGLTWKAYIEGLDEGAAGASCPHPALGTADATRTPGHPYQGFRNPFVYFDSLLESGACAASDVPLGGLGADLTAPAGPPNLSWIAPSACHDGAPTPCATGATAGLAGADAFLRQTVPPILNSSAYRNHGLVLITFDAGPTPAGSAASTGEAKPADSATADSAAKADNAANPVGALLISPFVRAHARVAGAYNQLSILASLERLFGIPLLGHAADADVQQLGGDVYLTTKKAA